MKKEEKKESKSGAFKGSGGPVKTEALSPSCGGKVWSVSGNAKMKETGPSK